MTAGTAFTLDAERAAWKLPRTITPSQWADERRILRPKLSSEEGRYDTARVPYLRPVMDALVNPDVEQVTFVKPVQSGGTEALINAVGYWSDEDPGPLLYVMPTEDDARGLAGTRLRSMLEDSCPEHIPDAKNTLKGSLWELDRMLIKLGWAESDASLGGFPCRYVVLDEVAKYRNRKGRIGPDRIRLAKDRTRTYPLSRKIVLTSTPEDEGDLLMREFGRSDQRLFHVPCPHCGTYAPLVFNLRDMGGHRFRFPDDERDPELIKAKHLAWFECVSCHERIERRHKRAMVARGIDCPSGCSVAPDGSIEGDIPVTTHFGFRYWAAYSPWVDWSEIAAEWLTAQGDPELLKAFYNQVLAEPWREKTKDISISTLEDRVLEGLVERVVPEDAHTLTLGVDVQADHLWYVVRGWSEGETSYLVCYGRLESFDELESDVVWTVYPVGDAKAGETMGLTLGLIDSGHRQDEVYDFCRRINRERPDFLRPTKGTDYLARGAPITTSIVDKDRRGRPIKGGLKLWTFVNMYFKDRLARRMATPPGQQGAFYVHEATDEEYFLQATAEEKQELWKAGQLLERWMKKRQRGHNDLWDCEVLNTLAAYMLGLSWRRSAGEHVSRPSSASRGRTRRSSGSGWVGGKGRSGGSWIRR